MEEIRNCQKQRWAAVGISTNRLCNCMGLYVYVCDITLLCVCPWIYALNIWNLGACRTNRLRHSCKYFEILLKDSLHLTAGYIECSMIAHKSNEWTCDAYNVNSYNVNSCANFQVQRHFWGWRMWVKTSEKQRTSLSSNYVTGKDASVRH